MTNKFPKDVLILIFRHLHVKQKIECALVCRTWAQVLLQGGYLFETIELSATSYSGHFTQKLVSLLQKTKSGVYSGKKCKRLLLADNQNGAINAASFATSFPNLSFLYSRYIMTYKPLGRSLRSTTLDSDPFLGWRNNLETLVDAGDSNNTFSYILNTGVFSRLTTLHLAKLYSNDMTFFSHLKNAPALTKLSMYSLAISPGLLENIHSNTPELTSLTLKGSLTLRYNYIAPLNVVPADKVRVFRLNEYSWHIPVSGVLSSYIKLKYTHLKEFNCGANDWISQGIICNVFHGLDLSRFITAVGSELSKCVISLKGETAETVNLIQNYLIQLESFGVDIFGCKSIFDPEKISQGQLNPYTSAYRDRLPELNTIEFKNFMQLKELILDFSNSPNLNSQYYGVTFGEILNKLPETINTLWLKGIHIIVRQGLEAMQSSSNVINLKLYSVIVIGEGLCVSLAWFFPKLTSLVLNYCNLNTTTTIELPDHHLRYIEFVPHRRYTRSKKRLFYLKITVPNRKIYYKVPTFYETCSYNINEETMDINDQSIQRVLKASSDTTSHWGEFHFKFASVQTFYCSSYLLLF